MFYFFTRTVQAGPSVGAVFRLSGLCHIQPTITHHVSSTIAGCHVSARAVSDRLRARAGSAAAQSADYRPLLELSCM